MAFNMTSHLGPLRKCLNNNSNNNINRHKGYAYNGKHKPGKTDEKNKKSGKLKLEIIS